MPVNFTHARAYIEAYAYSQRASCPKERAIAKLRQPTGSVYSSLSLSLSRTLLSLFLSLSLLSLFLSRTLLSLPSFSSRSFYLALVSPSRPSSLSLSALSLIPL